MSEKEVPQAEQKQRTYKDLNGEERTDLREIIGTFTLIDQIHVVYMPKKGATTALTSKADIEGMIPSFGEFHETYTEVRQAFIDKATDGQPKHQATIPEAPELAED